MDKEWLPLLLAVIAGLTGVPVMNYLGQRYLGQTTAADKLRAAEMEDRLAWRAEQQREVQSLKLENRTQQEALRDLEKRHYEVERVCITMRAQLDAQATEVARLQTAEKELKNRIRDLERELLAAYAKINSLQGGAS